MKPSFFPWIPHTAAGLVILATTGGVAAQMPPRDQAAFFGLDRLWDVRLVVSEKNWKAMFPTEPARGFSNVGRFDYVKARAEIAGHKIAEVGLRFKGNSTFMFTRGTLKRPFKIDFDRYNKQGEFLGLKKLNLNNNNTDPTQIREAISYQTYRDAGVAASRTCFARVFLTITGRINNEYLGMYTIVEQVDRRLMRRWFGSREGLLVKPERSILAHFGDKWNQRYDASYHPKTEATSQNSAALIGLAKLLRGNDSKAFEAGIAKVLDVDQFLNYVAVSVIIANLDSPLNLPHNYYLAVPDDRRLVVWIPWDLNLSLAGFSLAGSAQAELSVMEPSRLPILNRVLDIARYEDKYTKRLRQLIKGSCSAKSLTAHIKTARTATGTALKQEETRSQRVTEAPTDLSDGSGFARWGRAGGGINRFFGSRQTLEEFVVAREKSVIDQLDGKSQGRRAGFGFGFGLGSRGNRGAGGWNPFTTRDNSSTRLRRMLATGGLLAKDQGSFTVDEVKAAAGKLFVQLNTDAGGGDAGGGDAGGGDAGGGLDAGEIKPALMGLAMDEGARRRSRRRAEALASRHARRMVRDLDSDKHGPKDGTLTVAEWLAGVDKWFPRWDTNSDDMLDQQELAGRGSRR